MPVLRSALAGTETLQGQGQKFETCAEESLIIPHRASLKAPFARWGKQGLVLCCDPSGRKKLLGLWPFIVLSAESEVKSSHAWKTSGQGKLKLMRKIAALFPMDHTESQVVVQVRGVT